ncbi:MAG: Asp23/Gls24 family envelope stress response protein, partial [Candidatus Syntrophonatronum acetioxidans]
AAAEAEGVAGMSGGFTGGIAEILGKKNLSRGIKVEVGEKKAIINLYLAVYYETSIPDVASKVQEKVKESVENMTGLEVSQVNINVQGVAFKEEKEMI